MSGFDTDLKFLKGVGEARARLLAAECGLRTMRDLAYYFPFRHVDRSRFYKIEEVDDNAPMLQIRGVFRSFTIEGEGARQRLVGIFTDGSRMMRVVWFSRIRKMSEAYRPGVEYVLFGKPVRFREVLQMVHPEVEKFDPERPPTGFHGVYNLTENLRKKGISSRTFHTLVCNLLEHRFFAEITDPIPLDILSRLSLLPLVDAIRQLHCPDNARMLKKAIERMKFEELFFLELHILRYSRERDRSIVGHVFGKIGDCFNRFYNDVLEFELTGAQKRVLREIREDMRTGHQMNRLLQGDVGCGKTMVAFMTALMAIDNGYQAAIMAPTEILACQHMETLKKWCERIGVKVRLLTGSTRIKERREIHDGLEDGSLHLVVGTHALLEEKVRFHNLGLAVIDEQHRFGVAQRARMWSKNEIPPHVLVMTATPIPRTLAMTVYGDLEVSVIDELPPGRKPVDTLLCTDDNRNEVNRLLGNQLRSGRQVYVVYPLIKENDKLDLRSLEQGYDYIRRTFPDFRAVYVHGRMKPDEKDRQMDLFARGEARILVATVVIEVGVNVPNATVMVIENAERFGLSQLHQLRGRVGRGGDKSYCILMGKRKCGSDTRKRLEIMTHTTDGFLISEADMRLRGPGDLEGTMQSGLAFSLNIASLATDGQILGVARSEALKLLDEKADLSRGSILGDELLRRFARDVDWSQIS